MQTTSASDRMASHERAEMPSAPAEFPARDNNSKTLVFENVEERKVSGDRVFFLGTIKNIGKTQVGSVNIEVNLFKNGKFVDQYSSYLSGTIAAGESRYFKVACGCKDAPPEEHDSYKIQVLSGF